MENQDEEVRKTISTLSVRRMQIDRINVEILPEYFYPFTTYVVHKASLPKVIWEGGRVVSLSHTYTVKSPLVTMVRPKFAPKVPLPVDRSPNPTICLIPGPVRPTMPNGIRVRSAVFPQCTGQTDRLSYVRTDRQTDRSSTGKFDDNRPLRYESDAALIILFRNTRTVKTFDIELEYI